MMSSAATQAVAATDPSLASGALRTPRAVASQRAVLVFHIGSLGDTLVALPAFWAVRDAFPDARRVLLTKSPARAVIPVGRDILDGSGLFDDYLLYEGDHHAYGVNLPRWRKWLSAVRLIRALRAGAFDVGVYLAPSSREQGQIERDLTFFKLAGIRNVIGAKTVTGAADAGPVLEAERVLSRLADTPIDPPPLLRARRDLALTPADHGAIDSWLGTHQPAHPDTGPWVAFAPGSNLQSKLWPLERFEAVGRALIERFDVWPVIVGGPEDTAAGAKLLQAWGRGVNAAGALPVRQSAALLERCGLFVGNDTGTMHLAAACNVPCVALFSARDLPGKWEPMGEHHTVLRKSVPCAGCMLVRCDAQDRLCLRLIEVDEVVAAASAVLGRRVPVGLQA